MRPEHDNNFQAIRVLLASAVVYAHSFELMRRSSWPLPHVSPGMLAVDGFFLVSGYLIAQSWLRKPVLSVFLTKRTLRIFPG